MLDLTFGEQVKIVLSRKGMTIKELAECIEAETGKKMSRQNLTQRLGRDNFQEQDMRMIAKILDCPFQLNILDEDQSIESNYNEIEEEQVLKKRKKAAEKKNAAEASEEAVQMELPLYAERAADKEAVSKEEAERPVQKEAAAEEAAAEESVTVEAVTSEESVQEDVAVEEMVPEESVQEDVAVEEMVPEESVQEELAVEEFAGEEEEPVYEPEAVYEEAAPAVYEEYTVEEPVQEQIQPEKRDNEKKESGWFSSLRRRMKREDRHVNETRKPEVRSSAEATEAAIEEAVSEDMQMQETFDESGYTDGMAKEEFQDSGAYIDTLVQEANAQNADWYPQVEEAYREELESAAVPSDEEDLERGDVNPYTGHEYETNSVRVHPTKIGYVQVYDRAEHAWADMTEWAFLGYQEQKKALLGKDYEPPIYLD